MKIKRTIDTEITLSPQEIFMAGESADILTKMQLIRRLCDIITDQDIIDVKQLLCRDSPNLDGLSKRLRELADRCDNVKPISLK